PSPTHLSPLSLHDALPISLSHALLRRHRRHDLELRPAAHAGSPEVPPVQRRRPACAGGHHPRGRPAVPAAVLVALRRSRARGELDRKSTRLNSSHVSISYA